MFILILQIIIKEKILKKTLQTIVSNTHAAVTKILQGYFQMKEIFLLQ